MKNIILSLTILISTLITFAIKVSSADKNRAYSLENKGMSEIIKAFIIQDTDSFSAQTINTSAFYRRNLNIFTLFRLFNISIIQNHPIPNSS